MGRPARSRDVRAYLRVLQPVRQRAAGPRPDLLVTGSLHDPRVLIHEPAKWVARLRATAGTAQRLADAVPGRARRGRAHRAHRAVRPAGLQAEILAFVVTAARA